MAEKDTLRQIEDQVVEGIRKIDEAAVNATSALSRKLGEVMPEEIPGAERIRSLPRPEQMVRAYFAFVERVVKLQKAYGVNMVKAMDPVTSKIWGEAKVRKAVA